jgi:hypothetical protein
MAFAFAVLVGGVACGLDNRRDDAAHGLGIDWLCGWRVAYAGCGLYME